MLQQGMWQGRQVVPADWVRDSVAIHARSPDVRYGYQWWLGASDKARPDHVTAWSALGHGGQRIHILEPLRAVIVHTGSDYGGGGPELDRRIAQLLLPILV
jgi:CubicO group peptidase (beta-lactamase class C family)